MASILVWYSVVVQLLAKAARVLGALCVLLGLGACVYWQPGAVRFVLEWTALGVLVLLCWSHSRAVGVIQNTARRVAKIRMAQDAQQVRYESMDLRLARHLRILSTLEGAGQLSADRVRNVVDSLGAVDTRLSRQVQQALRAAEQHNAALKAQQDALDLITTVLNIRPKGKGAAKQPS